MNKFQSIGFFDSGVGGFSVVNAIKQLLPHENLVYLGDTARMPYGNKSKEAIIRYSFENAYFLQQHQIKMLVVACNTASVHALETLRQTLDIPVIGIIDDIFSAVYNATKTKKIAILGTKSTIQSGFFEKGFLDFYPNMECTSIACPLFATLVEEGMIEHPVTSILAKEYLSPIFDSQIDTLLLACTHYPFLENVLKSHIKTSINFIDPSYTCAKKAFSILEKLDLLNTQQDEGSIQVFASNDELNLKKQASRFLKFYENKTVFI